MLTAIIMVVLVVVVVAIKVKNKRDEMRHLAYLCGVYVFVWINQ